MRSKLLILSVLLGLLLAGCGGKDPTSTPTEPPTAEPTLADMPTAEPTPTGTPMADATADEAPEEEEVEAVELVPVTNEAMDIKGVAPDGWTEAAPGVYARRATATDLTTVIQQAAAGATTDQIATQLLPSLGLEELPESVGEFESPAFTWQLYQVEVEVTALGAVMVDLALAKTESDAYIVLLQTLADEYDILHESVFIPALEAFAPLSEDLSAETPEEEVVYNHPDGLFSVPVPTNWTVEEKEAYAVLTSPDGEMTAYVLALESDDFEAAVREAWAIIDPDFEADPDEVIDEPTTNGADRAVTITYDTGDEGPVIVAGGWQVDGMAYIEVFRAGLEAFQRRSTQAQLISSGFDIAALEDTDLAGIEPLPITEELIDELEAYIVAKMAELDVPGAAVAIVQGGEMVYANGFGVRNLESGEPVTPETLMMIGSTTKSMTTMLMAHLVDEGVFDWDTPVLEVFPDFRVVDPEITEQITMQNLVCACTGVPRRDLEWLFNAEELSAEEIVESLAEFEFFTDFGEAFQYSNQMVATGGYLAALAAGGVYGELYDAYVTLMQDNILDPIGLTSSTFSFDEVRAGGVYATPYGKTLLGENIELSLSVEEVLVPIGPAGALWSNVLDMASYLEVLLNDGTTAEGTEIASAENLAVTWEPQVDITADASYGLGWIVEEYKGVPVISHAGNTFGFTSELAFLPEADLGITILTNQRGSALNNVVRYRLLEMIFDQEPEVEEILQFQLDMQEEAYADLRDSLQEAVDPDIVAEYVGSYTNADLGEVTLEVQDGALILDVGEFQAEVRARRDEDGEISYLTFVTPLEGIPVEFTTDDNGEPTMILGIGVLEYTFEK
jgi:CubicO group peptidase (beta-lactamase class C family)